MTNQDNDRRNFDEAPAQRPADDESPGWALPIGISAVALLAGILIFSAAGPDRTKTAQFDNTKANPLASQPTQPPESAIPKSDAPAATPAPAGPGQKSNPAGTQ
jgi:hypothetical protein